MIKIDFRLYLVTDRRLCPGESLTEIVHAACQAGVRAIQLREKDLPPISIYNLAKEIKQISDSANARLFINDRFDLVQAIDADGVHLTSQSLPAEVIRKVDASKLIGVSTHSLDEARAAEQSGADFILFGPVFPTPSKLKYGKPQGLEKLHTVCQAIGIPVFAVGGITPERAKSCLEHGAFGVAAISSIMNAPEVAQAVNDYEKALGNL